MSTFDRIRDILNTTLNLGDRAHRLTRESALLGAIAEFDSMSVVIVVTRIEDELGIALDDDEISAEVFESVGSLVAFVDSKLGATSTLSTFE